MHSSCIGRRGDSDWSHAQHPSPRGGQRQSLSDSEGETDLMEVARDEAIFTSIQCAREGARCDYGLYVGASSSNSSSLSLLAPQALSLKMYLNTTFSTLQLDSMETWMKV